MPQVQPWKKKKKNGPVCCHILIADHNLLHDTEAGWSSGLAFTVGSDWSGCACCLCHLVPLRPGESYLAGSSAARWDSDIVHITGGIGKIQWGKQCKAGIFTTMHMSILILLFLMWCHLGFCLLLLLLLLLFFWVAKFLPLLEEKHDLLAEKRKVIYVLSVCG